VKWALKSFLVAILFSVASIPLTTCGHPQDKPYDRVVETTQGRVAGLREGRLSVFRGIPYAAPPVGKKRWTPPSPSVSWAHVLEATRFGPSCTQPEVPTRSLYFDPPETTSEDCLTLNIWADSAASNAPVIVWIHGGSLRIGGSAQTMYDGSEFAGRGVVFVSLNYRLGLLGWMAHPELSAESPEETSGNYGLLDQVAALQWIRTNIAAFGGNPNNITVMGESAGALSVSYLLASPQASGLFEKAILQSTNSRNFPELHRRAYGMPSAEQIGATVLDALELDTLQAAREMNAQGITDAAGALGFVPQGTVDGRVLPKQIMESFEIGSFAQVPVLAGFNSGEVRSQRAFLPRAPKMPQDYEEAIVRRYGDKAEDFLAIYPAGDTAEMMLATLRDAIYGWATERLVRKVTEVGEPAYMYVFDYCYPSAGGSDLCAFHASELPFVFGAVDEDKLPPNWPVPDGEQDKEVSNAMMDYWISFAATGRPESAHGPVWPAYGADQNYLSIAPDIEARTDPFPGMFELHERLVVERKNNDEPWFLNVGIRAKPR
jgi:para-nitrobenzyl esterase